MLFKGNTSGWNKLIELWYCNTNSSVFWACCCDYSIHSCPVMSFSSIALHCIVLTLMPLWPCACLVCPSWWIAYCTSIYSGINIVASPLGTLDIQWLDVKHVLTEPNHKTALVNVSWRWKDWLECMLEPEILSSWSNWRPGPRSEGPKALLILTLVYYYPR